MMSDIVMLGVAFDHVGRIEIGRMGGVSVYLRDWLSCWIEPTVTLAVLLWVSGFEGLLHSSMCTSRSLTIFGRKLTEVYLDD